MASEGQTRAYRLEMEPILQFLSHFRWPRFDPWTVHTFLRVGFRIGFYSEVVSKSIIKTR